MENYKPGQSAVLEGYYPLAADKLLRGLAVGVAGAYLRFLALDNLYQLELLFLILFEFVH